MYQPNHFRVEDLERAKSLIEAHPFATLISPDCVSHIPLIIDETKDVLTLQGHVARKNPHWQSLERDGRVLALFHGPHAYITPRWYAEHDVPTWNYAVVHATCSVRLINTRAPLTALVAKLAAHFERGAAEPWAFSLPEDLRGDALAQAIVGFELKVEMLGAKFKLSQNRSQIDQAGVKRGLAQRTDDDSRGVLRLMGDL